jgi:uncharacterized membrane protein
MRPYLPVIAYCPRQNDMVHTAAITLHIAGAMVATIIGPFQFLPKIITRRYVNLHHWLGRTYLVGILVGGLGGFYMSFLAYGGVATRLGFGILAVLWLFCGFTAYRRIRNKQIQSHRQWMIRTYALTFAAVTLRIWLPLLGAAGVDFDTAYLTVAWLCWIPNPLVAEWIVSRIRRPRPTSAAAFAS